MESWPHLKYDFLQPSKIRDMQRKSLSDPNYDPKTVYVPMDFLNQQTPVRLQILLYSAFCNATLNILEYVFYRQ